MQENIKNTLKRLFELLVREKQKEEGVKVCVMMGMFSSITLEGVDL